MSEGTSKGKASGTASSAAYAPLHRSVFRAIWLASLVSNVGTWIQNVGAAWLMTELSSSPLMVSLIQAATTLPVFFIGIPAGILADIVDRRRLLLVAQAWMLVAAGALAAASIANVVTPTLLLALTFALGCGFALNAPAWQAIIPELVPRQELPAAIGLNGVGMNASRAVGPAIGGLVVAAAGPGVAFLLNALSFVAVLVVLFRWKRPILRSTVPVERFVGAAKSGLRYMQHAPAVQSVLIRTMAFVSGAGGLWALLPAVTRVDADRGPGAYGILLGCLGLGAMLGIFVLPTALRLWSTGSVVLVATLSFSGGTAMTAVTSSYVAWCISLIIAGAGWLAVLTSMSTSVQSLVPAWVRARVISVYLLVFYGGLAGGSIAWGIAAERVGPKTALALSAIWTATGLCTALRYRLPEHTPPSIDTTGHWPEAPEVPNPDAAGGPVLVLVECHIQPADAAAFFESASRLRRIRLRDGAFRWDLFEDPAIPGRYVESFMLDSWAEHVRQHDRGTGEDEQTQAAVRSFHTGDAPPRVTHLIAATGRPLHEPENALEPQMM